MPQQHEAFGLLPQEPTVIHTEAFTRDGLDLMVKTSTVSTSAEQLI